MKAERWEEVQVRFDELVELDTRERASRLASLAVTDPDLHRALESLLQADAEAGAQLAPIDALLLGSHESDPPAPLLSALAERYRIEREIGSGGMATVYLARDLKHDRDVALKVLRPQLAAMLGPTRFLNEIKISARLDHPHILTLIDSGAANGFLYYVMPFVRGESLRDRLKREKQLGIDDAVDITRQVTSALDYAHRQGIVHRDIKPENILLHEGEAVLADFGIATAVQEAGGTRLTQSGVSLGTPQYMSPEQASGDGVLDSRSDVYSMAAVLYEMLAGEPPHTGVSKQAVIAKLLSERPTRLRVIRETVPEAVDAAVAKALAMLPTDRYAHAGDFARALVATGRPARTSARSRRWIPLALGTVAVTAAVAAVIIQVRRATPPPQPDLVQLTVTGLANDASLSPDGTRLAFEEKQCDESGHCSYQVVIQDTDGRNRLVLSQNAANVFRTAWTPDGRYLLYDASYNPERWGAFVISTLGGAPRHLGAGDFAARSGDTLVVAVGLLPPDSIGWVRRITAHDGRTLDSIPLHDPGAGWDVGVVLLPYPERVLVAVRKTWDSAPELRLLDFRGEVIDRVTPGFGSLGRRFAIRWLPTRQKLVVVSQRAVTGTDFDILSMDVTASRIERGIDTVFSGLQMTGENFDISRDGERFVHSAGPFESTVWTIDTRRTSDGRFAATQVGSWTTRVGALISPNGDRIVVARDVPTGRGRSSDFSILPRNGGAESQIASGVPNLLDFEWSPDGATIMYLHGIEGNKVRLIEIDTSGRQPREIALLEESAAIEIHPLPDRSVSVIPPERRSISIVRRGKREATWRAPDWIGSMWSVSLSPNATSLAVLAIDPPGKSIVVATVDIENGQYTKLGSVGGEWPGWIRWLEDGSIMFDVVETPGAWGLFKITPGGLTRRLGTLPVGEGFSASKDGRHMAALGYGVKSDVYMIRNFGTMLRR